MVLAFGRVSMTLVATIWSFHGLVDAGWPFPIEGTACLKNMFRHCSGDWKGYVECTNTTSPMNTATDKYGPTKACASDERCGPVDWNLGRDGYRSDNLGCIKGIPPTRLEVNCTIDRAVQCDSNGKDIWICLYPQNEFELMVSPTWHWHHYAYCAQLRRDRNAKCTPNKVASWVTNDEFHLGDSSPRMDAIFLCGKDEF